MIISVIASKDIKIIQLFILTIIQTLISLYLASKFIENDTYWFKPFNRDKVVLLTSTAYFLGQLIIKAMIKWVK